MLCKLESEKEIKKQELCGNNKLYSKDCYTDNLDDVLKETDKIQSKYSDLVESIYKNCKVTKPKPSYSQFLLILTVLILCLCIYYSM